MNNTNDINAKTGVHEAVSSTEFVTETSNYTRTDNRNETEISSSSKNKSKKIPWIVNLTGKDYSIALDFKIIIKQLREHKNIKILNMNGCALKPEYSVLLFATLRKLASVDAFDLSNNQLSEPVEIQLIDYLRVSVYKKYAENYSFLYLIYY